MANIVTIKQKYVPADVASKFGLVPDSHHSPKWYKLVIMEHATIEKLKLLLSDL